MREGGEERRHLDGDRNAHRALDLAQDVERLPLDVGGARRHVAGGVIEVQFEAVGARLFELRAKEVQPPGVTPLSEAITGMPHRAS